MMRFLLLYISITTTIPCIITQIPSLFANAFVPTTIPQRYNTFQSLLSSSSTTVPRLLNTRSQASCAASSKRNPLLFGMGRALSSRSRRRTSTSVYASSTSAKEREVMDSMLYRIRKCNHVPQEVRDGLLDFVVDGAVVGKVTNTVAECLCNHAPSSKPVFEICNESKSNKRVVTLSKETGHSPEARTEAIMTVMTNLHSKGVITGWRDELLPLSEGFYNDPVALVERAAAPFLGMQQYGVHINGFVKTPDGKERMWMARRSATKSKYPGMLDHIVAGGQPAGIGVMENVLKECNEEAGIMEDVALQGIQAAGAISYECFEAFADNSSLDGVISRSALFCYDLELPPSFEPTAIDGEVEEFFQWSIEEVIESLHKDYCDPIKPNCYLVIIDFLLRRGYISPDTPGYLDVLRELRSGFCG